MIISGRELQGWRQRAREGAIAAGIPPEEVDWLLRELEECSALTLQFLVDRPSLDLPVSLSELERLWQCRLRDRVPLQHLVGRTHWRHFTLKVSPDVLIPRPETEILVDLVAEAIGQNPALAEGHWVDLGTGSGAIAFGLSECLPRGTIHAVDSSAESLAIARENARMLVLEERIKFYRGSWWQPLSSLAGKISGMVSNPPYIPSALIPQLQPEVSQHEPHLALDGGCDGLDAIRYLVETAPDYLHPGGLWAVEMMDGQAETVARLLEKRGQYCHIRIVSDLAKIDRFALAYRQ
ncbi:MAG: peptide chain release factor N(5)-glutamine methyltransferase [Cyanobacteria bacterium SBLK]|nr:peptide chain release factor N(5)-glutamine methyltransferase [Cyanobacteria bacterium SBLK]